MTVPQNPEGAVPICPMPISTRASQVAEVNGKSLVLLELFTPAGLQVYFLDPAHARKLADDLTAAAQLAGTGLIVPSPVMPPPANVRPT